MEEKRLKIDKMKNEKAGRSYRSTVWMYEQQLEHLPFANIDALKRRVDSLIDNYNLDKFAMIQHAKDVNAEGKRVKPHIHLVMTFKERVAANSLGKVFGDQPQQFERMTKRGNSAKKGADNAFMYLIHQTDNSRDKYQYRVEDVVANFDYANFVSRKRAQIDPKDIIELLGAGEIQEEQARAMMMGISANTYFKYSRRISEVALGANKLKFEKWLKNKIETKESIKVIWIYGGAGTGKTRYAVEFADKRKISFFKTVTTNDPFEGYNGQKILIIDELRPETLKYPDVLHLLDPMSYEKKTVARYHNSNIMADFIFVTTPYDPLTFYEKITKLDRSVDSFEQLRRRIGLLLHFKKKSIDAEYLEKNSNSRCGWNYCVSQSNENPYLNNNRSVNFSLEDLEQYGKSDDKK
ncbi:Rep family protein [Liquorilactobacillus satsumensis]|uniref:Rep family protein n=1 Tax=Liquorilactobacillus satsumensis TaxID=259059 RepID=UPI0039EA0137